MTLPDSLTLLRRRASGEVVPVMEALSVVTLWLAEREGNRHVVPLESHDLNDNASMLPQLDVRAFTAPFLPHHAAAEMERRYHQPDTDPLPHSNLIANPDHQR